MAKLGRPKKTYALDAGERYSIVSEASERARENAEQNITRMFIKKGISLSVAVLALWIAANFPHTAVPPEFQILAIVTMLFVFACTGMGAAGLIFW